MPPDFLGTAIAFFDSVFAIFSDRFREWNIFTFCNFAIVPLLVIIEYASFYYFGIYLEQTLARRKFERRNEKERKEFLARFAIEVSKNKFSWK